MLAKAASTCGPPSKEKRRPDGTPLYLSIFRIANWIGVMGHLGRIYIWNGMSRLRGNDKFWLLTRISQNGKGRSNQKSPLSIPWGMGRSRPDQVVSPSFRCARRTGARQFVAFGLLPRDIGDFDWASLMPAIEQCGNNRTDHESSHQEVAKRWDPDQEDEARAYREDEADETSGDGHAMHRDPGVTFHKDHLYR